MTHRDVVPPRTAAPGQTASKRWHDRGERALAVALAVLVAACSSNEITEGPDEVRTPGIEYTASTSELEFDGTVNLLVTLTIENKTADPVTLTYPAGCPLRIRLYRLQDDALRYDETRVACTVTDPVQLTIQPQTSRSLGSGFRNMTGIAGDSLAFTNYRVVAVPRTEGSSIIEVSAGSITLKQ